MGSFHPSYGRQDKPEAELPSVKEKLSQQKLAEKALAMQVA